MTLVLFLFGAIFGSFANVCAWRMPRGESIVFPGSHCPRCGAALRWYHNVPVASYLVLRGRCAACGGGISAQYPAVELLCGLLFAAQALRHPAGVPLFLGLLFSFGLLTLSVIDFHHQIIPDVFSLGLLGVALVLSPWNPFFEGSGLWRAAASLGGAAAGFGLMYALAWGGEKVFKKESLGGGDIKLMAAVGAWLGWSGVFSTLFIGSLAGTLCVAALMLRGRLRRGDYLPFGPFLAGGAWAAWMGAEALFAGAFSPRGLPFP